MTETNPTAAEFPALLAEAKVAKRLCSDAKGSIEEEAAGERVTAASNAILSARPTDPGVMAAQLRFLVAGSSAPSTPSPRAAAEFWVPTDFIWRTGLFRRPDLEADQSEAAHGKED